LSATPWSRNRGTAPQPEIRAFGDAFIVIAYGKADPPRSLARSRLSTRLSTETLSKNHNSLTGAGQGEGVELGEAAELDVGGQAAQH
jgi:hypothetical protein